MRSTFFHFQPTLNRLFKNGIKLVILILDYFFLKYEGGRDQTDSLPEKTILKKPDLIRVNLS